MTKFNLKTMFFVMMFLMFLSSTSYAFTEPKTKEEFYDYVRSSGYKVETDNGLKANFNTYKEYDLIVWGDPFGRYKNGSMCGRSSEYEYLGYKEDGTSSVGNRCFPNDVTSGEHPTNWDFTKVPGAVKSWERLTESQVSYILTTPLIGHGADESDALTIEDIGGIEYAKIEVPPTWFNKGSIYTENNGVKK